MTTQNTAQTYVLVGARFGDGTIISEADRRAAEARGVKFVRVEDFPDYRAAVTYIKDQIKKSGQPANIVLGAHGGQNGTFEWQRGQTVRYADLFSEFQGLPTGTIQSITLQSCYGGSAQTGAILSSAPAGAVVQTMVSDASVGWSGFIQQFTSTLQGQTNQMDMFLTALGQFSPQNYEKWANSYNERQEQNQKWNEAHPNETPRPVHEKVDADPLQALPHIIGIGGGTRVDLSSEMADLSKKFAGDGHEVNQAAWDASLKKIKEKFPNVSADQIRAIAEKIRTGKTDEIGANGSSVHKADELRVAYALTAAYLDASGELKNRLGATNGPNNEAQDPGARDPHVRDPNTRAPEARDPSRPILPNAPRTGRGQLRAMQPDLHFTQEERDTIQKAMKDPTNVDLLKQEQAILEKHGLDTGIKNHNLVQKGAAEKDLDGVRGSHTRKAEQRALAAPSM